MSPTIYSFIGLTLTLIIFLLWSIKEDNEGWTVTLVIALIAFGLFGWGIFLSTATDVTKIEVKQAKVLEILKGKHITVVSTSENHNQVYSGYECDAIDSTTIFKWRYTYKYNYYGFEVESITEFITEHDTSKNTVPEIKVER